MDRSNPTNLPVPAGTVMKKQDEYHDLPESGIEPFGPLEHQVYQQSATNDSGRLMGISHGSSIMV